MELHVIPVRRWSETEKQSRRHLDKQKVPVRFLRNAEFEFLFMIGIVLLTNL